MDNCLFSRYRGIIFILFLLLPCMAALCSPFTRNKTTPAHDDASRKTAERNASEKNRANELADNIRRLGNILPQSDKIHKKTLQSIISQAISHLGDNTQGIDQSLATSPERKDTSQRGEIIRTTTSRECRDKPPTTRISKIRRDANTRERRRTRTLSLSIKTLGSTLFDGRRHNKNTIILEAISRVNELNHKQAIKSEPPTIVDIKVEQPSMATPPLDVETAEICLNLEELYKTYQGLPSPPLVKIEPHSPSATNNIRFF